MKKMLAIWKKEAVSAFSSPMAYTAIVVFLVITGMFFSMIVNQFSLICYNIQNMAMRNPQYGRTMNLTDMAMRALFLNMGVILLFITPLLTMRLFAEEKKSGTIELLFTYPVRDLDIVLGKYLASLTVLFAMLGLTVIQIILVSFVGKVEVPVMISAYLGLFLMSMAFIAMGLFISSLTENQIVAAVLTFSVFLLLWIVGWASDSVGETLGKFLKSLSIIDHYEGFAKGVINTSGITFYLFVIIFSLFCTLRMLESKKWRS